jgi:DNA-binding CsgD family transcriptional regulator
MQFREATEADAEAIAATFDGNNALPLEPRVRAALPGLLRQLIASPACTLTVFEESDWAQSRVVSFASGLFLRDEVIDDYLAAPYPALLAGVLAQLLDGRRPLLTLDEIRHANSNEGLIQAVFPVPLGKHGLEDAWVGQLRRLAPQAMMRDVGGYRLRAIYYEVFTDEVARYLQGGGFRLLHDFSTLAGTGFLRPDSRPRMLRLTSADLPAGAMSTASQMFDPPRPVLGLTPAEQRVALKALDGASDRALAEALGLSEETVHARWRSIYERLSHVLPQAKPPAPRDGGARRSNTCARTCTNCARSRPASAAPAPRRRRDADAERTGHRRPGRAD